MDPYCCHLHDQQVVTHVAEALREISVDDVYEFAMVGCA